MGGGARWLMVCVIALALVLAGCAAPATGPPIRVRATASMPDGSVPDAATLENARAMVADRLRYGDMPPAQVNIEGDRTLLIRLTWANEVLHEVFARLRPGRLQLRPVAKHARQPAGRGPDLPQEQVDAMPAEAQFAEYPPACRQLDAEIVEIVDPGERVAIRGDCHRRTWPFWRCGRRTRRCR